MAFTRRHAEGEEQLFNFAADRWELDGLVGASRMGGEPDRYRLLVDPLLAASRDVVHQRGPETERVKLDRRCCLVTGANGFLGRQLSERLLDQGWSVRGLVRDPARYPFQRAGIELYEGDLPDRIDEAAFLNADVVIHCAYTSHHTTLEEARRVNEEGSGRVFSLARENGARFVFISSTGAHDGALSYYARSKLAIERRLDLTRDLVIRPGLILGDGGLFKRIVDSLQRFGFVPVFDGGRQKVQTVHVEDLCRAIERAVDLRLSGCYVVAEPEGIELRELFREIARRMGRKCRLVPLPATPLLLALRTAERMGLRLPLTSENVLGARSLRVQPSEADLRALGVEVRSASESLSDLLGGQDTRDRASSRPSGSPSPP